jgi:hypothetical protein
MQIVLSIYISISIHTQTPEDLGLLTVQAQVCIIVPSMNGYPMYCLYLHCMHVNFYPAGKGSPHKRIPSQ